MQALNLVMKRKFDLQIAAKVVVGISIFIQLFVLFYFWGAPQYSDNRAYMDIAIHCFESGKWYPMTEHLHSYYIWTPGLINFFILQLHLFGTLNFNEVFNFIMNLIMLADVYYIAKKLFNQTTAYWSLIIYSITYSNIIGIAVNGTEIPFLCTALTALTLCLYQKSFLYLLLAALLFFISNTIRPLVILYIIIACSYFFVKKYHWSRYALLVIPYFLFCCIYGFYNKQKIGEFVYQSTTSGVNLLMSAHDDADGTTSKGILAMRDSTKNCYTGAIAVDQTLTFKEKDKMMKNMAFEWIKENPWKYIKICFYKVVYMYADDAWGERLMFDTGFAKGLKNATTSEKISKFGEILLKNVIYYLTWLAFLYALIRKRKEIFSEKGILLGLLLVGTGATCLFATMPRYHYPFMFVIIIWAAYGIDTYLHNKMASSQIKTDKE